MKYGSTMSSHLHSIAKIVLKYFQQMAALALASISLGLPTVHPLLDRGGSAES